MHRRLGVVKGADLMNGKKGRLRKMEPGTESNGQSRLDGLRDILNHQRNMLLARVREFRRDQEQEKESEPSDDLDIARAFADVETHASLIERSEDLLKLIDGAFGRLDAGRYGICDGCGADIPLARLKALPFAIYCVDCQQSSEPGRGRGTVSESFMRRWVIPEEMDESLERQDSLTEPEDVLIVHSGNAFGPEQGELVSQPSRPPRALGRRRKKA
jgi:DnaK suppressor protein